MLRKLLNIKILLFLIVLLAGFLRFYQLGSNPPSLTWDEAAWGYNAYSLSTSGKDEFGKFLPISYLESFGDFKPPMYAYLDVIPVKLLGLNEFSTRFPSAFFGTLTVLLVFFLVRRIFKTSKNKDLIAILSAFFLAISPWHILLSRAAFEANIANFLIVLGVLAFFESINKWKWMLIISAASFALSFYVFNTARIVSPIIVLLLILIFRKKLWEMKKITLLSAMVGFIIFAPIFSFLLGPQASLRFKEVNIFSDSSVVKTANVEIANDGNSFWSKAIHNRRVLYGISYAKHYFDNLSPNFLFIAGDGNPKFSIQTVGQMYIFDIAFLVIGALYLLKKKEGYWWFIPVWLMIGIIPAAVARETPHALRIESSLPTFQILAAYGFVVFLTWVKKLDLRFMIYDLRKFSYVLILISFILLFINFAYFYHSYFYNYPTNYSGEWQYGYKQSIDYVKSVEKDYDYIQVTNALGRPYIYYLFYTKTSPYNFGKTAIINRDAFGFVTVNSFGKYVFPSDYNYELSNKKKVLYINTPYKLPQNIRILKTFNLLNGQPVLVAYTI
jgi:4-amino-4-deoxy-L-arabinose transferase-like glycosyltransferase